MEDLHSRVCRRGIRTSAQFLFTLTSTLAVVLPASIFAAELRVLDQSGLLRAVKVVRGDANVVVKITSRPEQSATSVSRGECIAVNVDGLAAEKRAPVSSTYECVFKKMTEGSWQISVPEKTEWQVGVYE